MKTLFGNQNVDVKFAIDPELETWKMINLAFQYRIMIQAYLKRLRLMFLSFFYTTSRSQGGTGLGLSAAFNAATLLNDV